MNYEAVLAEEAEWSIDQADALAFLQGLPDSSCSLLISSPPYASKSLRYQGQETSPNDVYGWIDWMFKISLEAVRVCTGDVLWVVNSFVKNGEYHPVVEGLIWKWYSHRQLHQSDSVMDRPCIWSKNAPPSRKDWFAGTWEYVLCFKREGKRPYWNWEAIAEPPKYKAGGRFRQRNAKGERKLGNEYPKGKLTRPKDVIRATVGGGHMGSDLAHLNEAPFPEKLVEYFIQALCPPGGITLDPFCGSGTTLAVALKHGRRFIGCDIRSNQVELTNQRATEAINARQEIQRLGA